MGQHFAYSELDALFFEESLEMLENAASAMIMVEKSGNIMSAIPEVFRTFHSIKGGSQLVGCTMLAEFAHHIEDLLDHVRSGRRAADAEIASLVLQSLDLMEEELACYRQNKTPDELAARQQDLLALAKALAPNATRLNSPQQTGPASQPAPTPPPVVLSVDMNNATGRLVYMMIIIDTAAPMPEITEFLVQQRLAESGAVLFFTKSSSWFLSLEAILRTELDDQELRRSCNAADINAIHVKELSPSAFHLGLLPHLVAEDFITLVNNLSQLVASPTSSQKDLLLTMQELVAWGEDHIESSGCFAGGISEWDRALALLSQAVALWPSLRSTPEQRILIELLVQNLWEWVYNSLRNKVFFFELRATPAILESGLLQEVKSLIKAGVPGLVVLDLSAVPILETPEVDQLLETRNWLRQRNIDLVLVATGEFQHRHQNTAEALVEIFQGMSIYSSVYQACRKNCADRA